MCVCVCLVCLYIYKEEDSHYFLLTDFTKTFSAKNLLLSSLSSAFSGRNIVMWSYDFQNEIISISVK